LEHARHDFCLRAGRFNGPTVRNDASSKRHCHGQASKGGKRWIGVVFSQVRQ
jgi:hypothetical protein